MLKFNAAAFYEAVSIMRRAHGLIEADKARSDQPVTANSRKDAPKIIKRVGEACDQLGAKVTTLATAELIAGFVFETKNDLNAKRGLREALSKNTATFHRVGDSYGLLEWYPKPKSDKPTDESKAAADEKPAAAQNPKPGTRKPRAASEAKRGSVQEPPARKEKPHVVHEPDIGPVNDEEAA